MLAFPPAFLLSLQYRAATFAWCLAALLFVIIYMLIYLLYIPLLYKSVSFGVDGGRLILKMGVFRERRLILPLEHIQVVQINRDILCRMLGLGCVAASAAGAAVRVPGLTVPDAEDLARRLRPARNGNNS